MEQGRKILKQLVAAVGKYKYTALILLLGIVLMCVPLHPDGREINSQKAEEINKIDDMENKLEEMLSLVDGAGNVRVLLSIQTGPAHIYQTDTQERRNSDTEETERQTVLVSSGADELPLEIMVTYPTYKGAVVVCDGADRAAVKLAVVQAVCTATGLGSDSVTVIKMHEN